jgi:hypothetical protein
MFVISINISEMNIKYTKVILVCSNLNRNFISLSEAVELCETLEPFSRGVSIAVVTGAHWKKRNRVKITPLIVNLEVGNITFE